MLFAFNFAHLRRNIVTSLLVKNTLMMPGLLNGIHKACEKHIRQSLENNPHLQMDDSQFVG